MSSNLQKIEKVWWFKKQKHENWENRKKSDKFDKFNKFGKFKIDCENMVLLKEDLKS